MTPRVTRRTFLQLSAAAFVTFESAVPSGRIREMPPLRGCEFANTIQLESGVRWERLTARTEKGVEFIYSVYAAGGESAPAGAAIDHGGREFGTGVSNTAVLPKGTLTSIQ